MKQLIITGFNRSGTTALTDLLNIDGRLFITYEKKTYLAPKLRRKWNQRNDLILKKRRVEYIGDKATRPYAGRMNWIMKEHPGLKIIFCLRDPIDIINSKYWKSVAADPIVEYVRCMSKFLYKEKPRIYFVRYEDAVLDIEGTIKGISEYLGIEDLNITGNNYRAVRRYGWKSKNFPKPTPELLKIREQLGYESIGFRQWA